MAEIDSQHLNWAQLINKLYSARKEKLAATKILETFEEMISTMEQHFITEEGMLAKNQCPDTAKMRKAHKEVFDRVVRIKIDFQKHRNTSDIGVFLKFLREYFISHTQRFDRTYISFLKQKYIVWEKQYDFGIEEIDSQHQGIADQINNLYEQTIQNKSRDKDAVLDALSATIMSAISHFEYEEKLVEKHSYPFVSELKQEHREFISQLTEHKSAYIESGKGLGSDIFPLFRDWLINHTQGTDRKYLPFLQSA